ncbi:MAG TPA: carbohydrate kinase [Ktedonobacterales bacterium]
MERERRLITCLGEGLMDFLPIDEAGATVGFRLAPGGSILNVAVALARLGSPVAFAGKLANDFFGQRLRAYALAEGVRLDFLASVTGHSTLAFVVSAGMAESAEAHEPQSAEPSFMFYGEGAADTLLTASELPAALDEETAILHIGSISLLRGTTPLAVRAVAERLKGRALLSLDPNIRPSLVTDEPGYRATLDYVLGLADVLKLSVADLAWLEPGAEREDPLAVAARYVARGPALVALTLGAQGAVIATASGARLRASAPQVALVDTVGAGDAFNAALLSALAERGAISRESVAALSAAELAQALDWAVTVAALTCARAGANPPTRAEALAWRDGRA